MTHLLRHALEPVVHRRRGYLVVCAAVVILAMLCLAGVAALRFAKPELRGQAALGLLLAVVVLLPAAGFWFRRWRPDYRAIARSIEQRHPELHSLLITAVEQSPAAGGEINFLQQRVVQAAIEQSRRQQWIDDVPAFRRNVGV